MSLYSQEEICEDCIYSSWHKCDKCKKITFCQCLIKEECGVDRYIGKCKRKTVRNKSIHTKYICNHEFECEGCPCIHCGKTKKEIHEDNEI